MIISKKLVADFLCLNKADQQWVLKNLSDDEARRLETYCTQARQLGLHKDLELFKNSLIEEGKKSLSVKKNKILNRILQYDEFWLKVYLGSKLKSERAKLEESLGVQYTEDDYITVPEKLVKQISDYIGQNA